MAKKECKNDTIRFRFTGVSPLMMHANLLSDPLAEITKEFKAVSSKRKKTDEDYLTMKEIEFRSALYLEGDRPAVPALNVEAAFRGAAREIRKGRQFESSMIVVQNMIPLQGAFPRNADKLFRSPEHVDTRAVRVPPGKTGSVVMRTRPIFPEWSIEFDLTYDPEILDRDQVIAVAEVAGKRVGIGDFRPRYGRFLVEVL